MKNKFQLLGTGCLTAILIIPFLAFTQKPEQKKTRHIRMMKIENGKKMEIDTILSGNDVFVWNGDTISPEKHIKGFSPSEFDKRHPDPMDNNPRKRRVHIIRDGALDDRHTMQGDSTEDIRIITDDGDTVGQKIIIHKRLKDGDERDHFIYLDERHNGHFPPVPGVPPVPHIRRFNGMNSSKMINLNDPNVISFKKKDISGGREKIEIIRKKTRETDNMDFTFDADPMIDVPQLPEPSVMEGTDSLDAGKEMLNQESQVKSKAVDRKAQRKADRQNK